MDTPSKAARPSSRPTTTSTKAVDSALTNPHRVNPSCDRSRPDCAKPFFDQLATDVQRRAENEAGKKRKAEAEARANAHAPGPIDTPGKRRKADQSQVDESLLSQAVEDLNDDIQKAAWYRAAIRRQGCANSSVDLSAFELPELIEMYNDSEAMEENKDNDNDMMEVLDDGPANASADTDPPPAKPPVGHAPKPLSRVDSSDHTTILGGVKPNDKRGRDENGKRHPLTCSGEIATPKKAKGKGRGRISTSPGPNEAGSRRASGPQHRLKVTDPPSRLQSITPNNQSNNTTTPTNTHRAPPLSDNQTPNNTPSRQTPHNGSTRGGRPTAKTNNTQNRSTQQSRGQTAKNTAAPKTPARQSKNSTSKEKGSHSSKGKTTVQPANKEGNDSVGEGDREGDSDGDNDSQCDSEDEEGTAGTKKKGVRKESQLEMFGEAKPIVEAVRDALKIRFIKKNPYADIEQRYTKPDEHGNRVALGYVIDEWLTKEWKVANTALRPEKEPLELERKHSTWLTNRFSRWRNTIRASTSPYIGDFGLDRSNTPEKNKDILTQLGNDGILSPTLTPKDPNAFQHPIFCKIIRRSYFNSTQKSLGYLIPKKFAPIPQPLLALCATVTHSLTLEFTTGEEQTKPLQADIQFPWFKMYSGIIRDIEHNNRQSFYNYWLKLFDECYGSAIALEPSEIEIPSRVYGPDTKMVYVSKVVPIVDEDDNDSDLSTDEEGCPEDTKPPKSTEQPQAGPSSTHHSPLPPQNATPGPSNTHHPSPPPLPGGSGQISASRESSPEIVWINYNPPSRHSSARPVEELTFTDPSTDGDDLEVDEIEDE